jgi:hypothetical protein
VSTVRHTVCRCHSSGRARVGRLNSVVAPTVSVVFFNGVHAQDDLQTTTGSSLIDLAGRDVCCLRFVLYNAHRRSGTHHVFIVSIEQQW